MAAILGGLLIIGIVALVTRGGSGSSGGQTCLDTAAGQQDALRASAALNAAGDAATAGDPVTASAKAREAADAWRAEARDMAADPAIAAPAQRAAEEIDSSADAIDAGNYALATSYIQEAQASESAATDAASSTSVPAC